MFLQNTSDADRQHYQDDLNKLTDWSEKWQMLFNFGKCKCLHTRHGIEDPQYTMGGTVLNTIVKTITHYPFAIYLAADHIASRNWVQ